MSRLITIDRYMTMLAEKTVDNSKQLKKGLHQRRNGMEDLYGVCFSANGDANSPATFYISLSPNYVYLEMFAFKFVIKPFTTTIKGATDSSIVDVNKTSLSVNNDSISPNPHDHTTQPHTHNVIDGMSFVQTTSTDWSVRIHGVDITDYLKEQQDIDPEDPLFDMSSGSREKVFPNNELSDLNDFYDILDVASVLIAEGNETDADKLLRPEFKKVEIRSDAPFSVDSYLYMKFSMLNR